MLGCRTLALAYAAYAILCYWHTGPVIEPPPSQHLDAYNRNKGRSDHVFSQLRQGSPSRRSPSSKSSRRGAGREATPMSALADVLADLSADVRWWQTEGRYDKTGVRPATGVGTGRGVRGLKTRMLADGGRIKGRKAGAKNQRVSSGRLHNVIRAPLPPAVPSVSTPAPPHPYFY